MASKELGSTVEAQVQGKVNAANPKQLYRELRSQPRHRNTAKNTLSLILGNINTSRGKVFTSRRRVRHDSLRRLREGVTYST